MKERQTEFKSTTNKPVRAVESPTIDEFKVAVRGLKNDNAAGKYAHAVELLKQDSDLLHQLLHRII